MLPHISTFLDAENLSPLAGRLALDFLAPRWDVSQRRAYRCAFGRKLARQYEAIGFDRIVAPALPLSNVVDHMIMLDALQAFFQRSSDGYCLVADDGHYTQLVMRLRQLGAIVLVFGSSNAAPCLKRAATHFCDLHVLSDGTAFGRPPKERAKSANVLETLPSPPPLPIEPLKDIALQLFHEHVRPGESMSMSAFSALLRDRLPPFKPQFYGSSSFTKLIRRLGVFQIEQITSRHKHDTFVSALPAPPITHP